MGTLAAEEAASSGAFTARDIVVRSTQLDCTITKPHNGKRGMDSAALSGVEIQLLIF